MANIYQGNVEKKIYTKTQTSMLTNALFVSGIGFVFTALIGFLCAWLFQQNSLHVDSLYTIATPLLIISVILSIVWQFRIEKASNLFMFVVVSLYCISNGIGFGSLFLALEMEQIMIAFGITGFIFLGTFGVSKTISTKVAMNLGKFLFIATMIYFVGSIIISLTSFFWIGNNSYLIILISSTFIGGLLSIGYLAYTFWSIQEMEKFLVSDDDLKRKYSIFFGFILLMNLISIVWRILQLMLIFDRN